MAKGDLGDKGDSNIKNEDILIPSADAGPDLFLKADQKSKLTGTCTDNKGKTISDCQWKQITGSSAILSDPKKAVTEITAPKVLATESLIFQLKATTPRGLESYDWVVVEVTVK